MIEYICDNCGKRIDDLPKEVREHSFEKHICRDCIKGMIREQAKKIAAAHLECAPYGQLLCIYQNLNGAYLNAMDIRTPWELPKCHVCGSEMKIPNPAVREYFCETCMVIYDRFGNKIRDVKAEEPARPSAGMYDTAKEIAKEEEEKLRKEGKWF